MRLEDFKQLNFKRTLSGRPSSTLTDRDWQTEFKLMKLHIVPNDKSVTRMGGAGSREPRTNEETKYDGMTNWQSYCKYINDVLRTIRSGKRDYVYFKYQIEDLLKFHYDTLRTKYCDGYWEVWLEI